MRQVISEIKHPETLSAPSQDVWTAAYDQWMRSNENEKQQKQQSHTSSSQNSPLPAVADDEQSVVTQAVARIATADETDEKLLLDLDTIEDLCYSGDNGRQMQASGGVIHLLRHCRSERNDVAIRAVRAIATCVQNNAPVMEDVVAKGGVGILLQVANMGDVHIRGACLRALVGVAESVASENALLEKRQDVANVVRGGVQSDEKEVNGRRCVIRGYALVEICVRKDKIWAIQFRKAGIMEAGLKGMESADVDIRESAARIVKLLR